jgi:tetratricopeptide (TPR) repeat protein
LADYRNRAKLPEAIHMMAGGYYDRAEAQQRQRIKEAGQDSGPRALLLALSQSAQQDFRKAIEKWEIVIQKLPASLQDTPRAYHLAGESYRQLGQPEKTLECYQKVCESWPDYERVWHLQFMLARLCRDSVKSGGITEQEADPKIRAALSTVVQKYPDCPAMKAASSWLEEIARLSEGDQK